MSHQEIEETFLSQKVQLETEQALRRENLRLKQELSQIKEQEERFRQIAENVREVFFVISAQSDRILYISPTYEKVWGRSCQSLYENPQSWLLAIHPEDLLKALATIETQFRTGEEFEEEYRIIRPDSSIRWVWVRAFPIRDRFEQVNRFVGIAEDITERKEAEEAVKASEEQFRCTFEMAPIGMALSTLEGNFKRVNQAFCDALGYTHAEMLQLCFAKITHPEDLELYLGCLQQLIEGKDLDFQIEIRHIAKDLHVVDSLLKVAIVYDSNHKPLHFNNQIVNITERKRMEQQLLYDALHDSLTKLPNRALLSNRLEQELKRTKNNDNYLFAVLFLDLDRFKIVNDSVGHLIGDRLLIEIARRLEQCVRPTDTVARLGGDEFTILLENIETVREATLVAERIYQALTKPFNLGGYEIFTTASIGIALSSKSYQKPEELLRDADLTMYCAKEKGKARYEVFEQSMRERVLKRLELESDLRRGIERKELILFYQPIVCLKTGKLSGFEALARWQHPTGGLISPLEFIPIAEETGLIVSLGDWLLNEACQQLRTWQLKYPQYCDLKISVNLSSQQLKEPQLIKQIDTILNKTGLSGDALKLEITESILMENIEFYTAILLAIKQRKIQLSLDDFGTGYSSLSYLHRFPVDTLKIDRSFVYQMQVDRNNSAIIKTIITLAHVLNLDVIAEGIENSFQLEMLKELNCEYGQGYFFSHPLTKEKAENLIINFSTQQIF